MDDKYIELFAKFKDRDAKLVKLKTSQKHVNILRMKQGDTVPELYHFVLPPVFFAIVVKADGKEYKHDYIWFKWKFKGVEHLCLYIDKEPGVITEI